MKDIKAWWIARKTVKFFNSMINFLVLTFAVMFVSYTAYAHWDSTQIYQAAGRSHYAVYKPAAENAGKSFWDLQAINPEVFAWLTINGTNIDYPVVQGPDNLKYIDKNAEGFYSASGAVFMDSDNSKHLDDFNSIFHGHHMAKKAMFGDIGTFANQKVFDAHLYGNLYFDDKDHGIEFFAFINADAYDASVYNPGIAEKGRQAYLDNLLAKALHIRDIGVTVEDQIILLSTCASQSTNGRDILIGRVTDTVFKDTI